MSLKNINKESGFTIVELLIVIVVIGILAAITIVAYNGVQNRARANSAQATAVNAVKKAELYNADPPAGVSGYPTTSAALTGAAATTSYQLPGVTVLAAATALTASNASTTTLTFATCVGGGVQFGYWDYVNAAVATVNAGIVTGACTRAA